MARVFLTGANGYLGQPLASELTSQGHTVRGLVRAVHTLPSCETVTGDALAPSTYSHFVSGFDTLVHLVGTPKPAPWKTKQFQAVDRKSLEAALAVALENDVQHFIYLSVAQPAPVMKSYIAVRKQCEQLVESAEVPATFLRPFYVLGPSHWWPLALLPLYKMAEFIPSCRASAQRLGLVNRPQMIRALAWAVANPPTDIRVIDVPQIRKF